jgi:nucleoid-associated protein YgaU
MLLLVSACATSPEPEPPPGPFETVDKQFQEQGKGRSYVVLDNKRYISGPYGDQQQVLQLIETIKLASEPVKLSNRIVKLPNKPANQTLIVYDFKTPHECGNQSFRVYESDEVQILQYDYQNDIELTSIRDYTRGPSPFVTAGLWGPYDHTDETALEMCLLAGDSEEDGMGLMEGSYEIGWITNIIDWKQAELGMAYANAVTTTNQCLQQVALAQQPTAYQSGSAISGLSDGKYVVQPGDTLGNIAKKVYGDFNRWIDLYTANSGVIGPDPNTLPVDISLDIPSP